MKAIAMVGGGTGPKKVLRRKELQAGREVGPCKIADVETCCESKPGCNLYIIESIDFGQSPWEVVQGTATGNVLGANSIALLQDVPRHDSPSTLMEVEASCNDDSDQSRVILGYSDQQNYLYAQITAGSTPSPYCGSLEIHQVDAGNDTLLGTSPINVEGVRIDDVPSPSHPITVRCGVANEGLYWAEAWAGRLDGKTYKASGLRVRLQQAQLGRRFGLAAGNSPGACAFWLTYARINDGSDECGEEIVCLIHEPLGVQGEATFWEPNPTWCQYEIQSGIFSQTGTAHILCESAGRIEFNGRHEPGAVRIAGQWEVPTDGDIFYLCYTDASNYIYVKWVDAVTDYMEIGERVGGVDTELGQLTSVNRQWEIKVFSGSLTYNAPFEEPITVTTSIVDGTIAGANMQTNSTFRWSRYDYHQCDPRSLCREQWRTEPAQALLATLSGFSFLDGLCNSCTDFNSTFVLARTELPSLPDDQCLYRGFVEMTDCALHPPPNNQVNLEAYLIPSVDPFGVASSTLRVVLQTAVPWEWQFRVDNTAPTDPPPLADPFDYDLPQTQIGSTCNHDGSVCRLQTA